MPFKVILITIACSQLKGTCCVLLVGSLVIAIRYGSVCSTSSVFVIMVGDGGS